MHFACARVWVSLCLYFARSFACICVCARSSFIFVWKWHERTEKNIIFSCRTDNNNSNGDRITFSKSYCNCLRPSRDRFTSGEINCVRRTVVQTADFLFSFEFSMCLRAQWDILDLDDMDINCNALNLRGELAIKTTKSGKSEIVYVLRDCLFECSVLILMHLSNWISVIVNEVRQWVNPALRYIVLSLFGLRLRKIFLLCCVLNWVWLVEMDLHRRLTIMDYRLLLTGLLLAFALIMPVPCSAYIEETEMRGESL